MKLQQVHTDKKSYLPLLLLADEQPSMIDRYLDRGVLFVLSDDDKTVGVAVVTDEGDGVCELKNLAAVPALQRRGYGGWLLEQLTDLHRAAFHTMLVGTGDSPATLPFYRRHGFVESHRIAGFFTENYDHPILENGISLTDMVVLRRPLWVLETDRLGFRRLRQDDLPALRTILGDPDTMYAWEYGFTDPQITAWIDKAIAGYAGSGNAYHAAVEKSSGVLIGLMGLLDEVIDRQVYPGLGYILARDRWGEGFAVEGARAWLDYAFSVRGAACVIAEIRPENTASRRVAERLGMSVTGEYAKPHAGKELTHLIYTAGLC